MKNMVVLLSALASLGCYANDRDLAAHFEEVLRPFIVDVKVTSATQSLLPGLYEVNVGTTIFYMTEDGSYALQGDLYDLKNKQNISKNTRNQARRAALAGVDPSQMITFSAVGTAKQELYVFTDIDCSYCRAMHREIDQLTEAGITVHYLAFPRTGIGTESYNKAVTVWCSADPLRAITEAKAGNDLNPLTCTNPVAEQYELGLAIGVDGTPAVLLPDGRRIGGYIPAETLIAKYLGDQESAP